MRSTVTACVGKARRKRSVVMLAGPPSQRQDDQRVVEQLNSSTGKRVVCGGTTANIVARQLNRSVEVDLETGTDSVPAAGRIEGIDLVTEGALTITKALEMLRHDEPSDQLKRDADGASCLAVTLREADEVTILAGRAINRVHLDPNLPKDLARRAETVQALGDELRRRGKQVTIEYF